jgi:hypothetical protein
VKLGLALPEGLGDSRRGDDPRFVKAALGGDFHLRPDSACIDAGLSLACPTPTLEYHAPTGFSFRAKRGPVDIGAFEYEGRP